MTEGRGPMRLVLLGNAGAGKTTLARARIGSRDVPHLSLDRIDWDDGPVRRSLADSLEELERFLGRHDEWVLEGCYADLVEAALPACTELVFLNPGVETCVRHCLVRPWEPEKFATPAEQHALLETLIAWVRTYETRDDEYGLRRHRALYERFTGPKRELTEPVPLQDA